MTTTAALIGRDALVSAFETICEPLDLWCTFDDTPQGGDVNGWLDDKSFVRCYQDDTRSHMVLFDKGVETQHLTADNVTEPVAEGMIAGLCAAWLGRSVNFTV